MMFLSCISIIAILLQKIQGFHHRAPKAPHSYITRYVTSSTSPSKITYSKVQQVSPFLREKSFSDLLDEMDHQQISHLYFTDDLRKIYSDTVESDLLYNRDISEQGNTNYLINELYLTYTNPALSNQVVESVRKSHTQAYILQPPTNTIYNTVAGGISAVGSLLNAGFTFYLFFTIGMLIFRRNNNGGTGFGGGGGAGPFGGFGGLNNRVGSSIEEVRENMEKANITLADWAGSPEIFEECAEVVSYLQNGTNYAAVGAQIPKGILLVGPPGTGKTLLAKAIASECQANFISIAASEFVEVFVGLGAQKVRNLFKEARENQPCILFIDEIDSIGKQRGTGINLGNDEREQTLNQLLAEMDGFNANEGVLILGATNRKDVLDNALLRPGRFDRVINVPLPDVESRKAIFKVHLKDKPIINVTTSIPILAEMTEGFSGAQIKNLVNEAAILAARRNYTTITQTDLTNALEKLVVGIAKRNDTRTEDTRTRVSIHEIGHAFLAAHFIQYFELKKVTIQATYDGAGGYTLFNERPEVIDGGLYTKEILRKRLVVAMGGKAAESLYYGDDFVSLGAVQDLKTANSLAQSMIGNFGMGEDLKVFYNEETDSGRNPFLGRSLAMGGKYSEKTKEKMDEESLTLVKEAYKEAFQILSRNKNTLSVLCKELMSRQTLNGERVIQIMNRPIIITDKNL